MSHLLIVAHSATAGGAENALKNFIETSAQLGHRATVLLPAAQGAFADWCRARHIECLVLPLQHACPTTTAAFVQLSLQPWGQVAEGLAPRAFDAVVSNTAVVPQGAHLAALLKLPHLVYVHELVDDTSEVRARGVPSAEYLRIVARGADHLLCCSEAVQARFAQVGAHTPCSVLYPFSDSAEGPQQVQRAAAAAAGGTAPRGRINLFTLGVQSIRKNPLLALTVLQALRLRGHDARLHCIGAAGTQTPRLQAAIQRRGLAAFVHLHDHTDTPYGLAGEGAIHLVCATSEAFGLTITECLQRGIAVAASRSGGPQHLLADSELFDNHDISGCVRIVERMAADPAAASARALARYDLLAPRFGRVHQQAVVFTALARAKADYQDKAPEPYFGPALRAALTLPQLPAARIAAHIANVAGLSLADVQARIAADKHAPGNAVGADCRHFDAVPFVASPQLDRLYREGVGFAIELAATCDDGGRMGMAAFILARLVHEATARASMSAPTRLRTLALGDGIGIDTLRLAQAGLDVDYIDYDASLTARVARLNFEHCQVDHDHDHDHDHAPGTGRVRVIADPAQEPAYDAVVCLEVIEHVSDPVGFLRMLASRLAPGGLLFISECFDGVRNLWPTHLHCNEDLGGLLPLMAPQVGLVLDDCNVLPYGKPYVLRKVAATDGLNLGALWQADKSLLRHVLNAQLQLGV